MKQSLRQFRALRCHRSAQAGLTGLVLLTGAMIAPPVLAGNYEFSHVETEDGEVYESESIPTTRPWSGNEPTSGSTSKSSIPSQSNYSVSVRSKGKIRSVFVWSATAVGPHNTPPLDDTLYVKVSPSTDVPIYLGYGTTATLSGLVVNNGFGDAPVNQGYGSSQRYVSRGVHLVAIKTNGQTELKTPFITMEGAVLLTGTTGYNTGSAGAGAYHTYLSEKTDRGILITSSIEESWKKVSNASALPTKTDPNTGMPYYDTSLIDPNTPWDGAGPWRVKCVRAPDGTMSVHSAADWFAPSNISGDPIAGTNSWFGRGIYNSNATGFTNPLFEWKVAGGTVLGSATQQINNPRYDLPSITLEPVIEGNSPLRSMGGLSLGGNANGSGLTTGSTISLKVTDTDGAVATDDYGVTWHLPNENWVMSGPFAHPKLIFPKAGYTVFNEAEVYSHEPNRTINFEIPHPTLEVSYLSSKNVLTNGSLALGVAGAGVAVWVALPAGAAFTLPVAIGVFLAATVATGMQVAAGDIPNPTLDTRQSDYKQYKFDMRLQKQINDARAIDPNAYPNEEVRCGDPLFVDAAVEEIERIEQLYGTSDNSGWDFDDNFHQDNGVLRCSAKAGRDRHREEWDGDEYDKHGYSGPAHATIIRPLTVFYVFNWTFAQSNPGPTGGGNNP